jgi:MFS family permease
MAEVVRVAGTGAAGVAVTSALFAMVSQLFDAVRQPSRRERWAMAAAAGMGVGVVLFIVSFVGMFAFLAWYAASSGEGPWLGMLYGAVIGGTPAAAIAYTARQRWRARQKRWPRWDRMRTPRNRSTLNLTELSTLPPNSPSSNAPPAGESGRTSLRPGNGFAPPSPIGESGEET